MLTNKKLLYVSAVSLIVLMFVIMLGLEPGRSEAVADAVADFAAPSPTSPSPQVNNAPLCTIPIPSYAVLGVVIVPTQVYYGPSTSQAISGLVIGGGAQLSKWYVIGQDATHQFWKIAIGCNFVWVPVGTLAPSPDGPNANAPLPTVVVT